MSQNGTMAAFTWPNAAHGTTSSDTTTSHSSHLPLPSAFTPTAKIVNVPYIAKPPTGKSTGVSYKAKPPTPTFTASKGDRLLAWDASTVASTAVDSVVFYLSDVAELTSTASDGGAFFSSSVSTTAIASATITSTAVDSGIFYSLEIPTFTSTVPDGATFFSSDVPVSSIGCHQCTACTQTTSNASAYTNASPFPKAVSNNPWNPYIAPPIDVSPSYVDYGTVSTLMPKATGVAFDRGTPFEMTDPTMPIANASSDLHSAFTKQDGPRFAKDPGHIIGVVILALGIVLVCFLAIKYFKSLIPTTHDLEKGNSRRRYPYYEEVVRGRRRYRDGSPQSTRHADIPISEGYGMDPVDLARAQNWQDGFDEKGAYATRDGVDRGTATDNFQSVATHGTGDNTGYQLQLPSFIPTRSSNPKSRPVTELPALARNPEYTAGQPVSPLGANGPPHDYNRTRDYSDVSPLHSPTMHRQNLR
ncbi:hypothetical protein BKA58DRAFT_402965 [Alternaria rosae]|uniref:uncharacterized protein n=1 Tax=Alternaria rosae TaxID=1187941 RepID=UPI001E8E37DD|nr:uncharacterized protein BKA58DRAFT_402965 [Alternaria rosae]KAH6868614.1 hypothetical protein BKA58DRAFT_402965 [Alternaria rosae]